MCDCLDFNIDKVVKSKNSLKPTWLKDNDYVEAFIKNHDLNLKTPSKYDVEIKVDLGSKFAGKRYYTGQPTKILIILH